MVVLPFCRINMVGGGGEGGGSHRLLQLSDLAEREHGHSNTDALIVTSSEPHISAGAFSLALQISTRMLYYYHHGHYL
jgi:hypothetical protein